MQKPSDWLKSNGWKPKRDDVPVRDTFWIDPHGKTEFTFIEALTVQDARERAKEAVKSL